jgi:hypothetical protein
MGRNKRFSAAYGAKRTYANPAVSVKCLGDILLYLGKEGAAAN